MATGGITVDSIDSWVKAGCSGFGLGGPLTNGGLDQIVNRVAEFRKAIEEARK